VSYPVTHLEYDMSRRLTLILALALPAGPSAALAERHEGFLFRITPGVSAAAATAEVEEEEMSLSGGAGQLGLTAGWAVAPRVILTLELLGHAILGPDLEIDGDVMETDDEVEWGISYAGLGANLYLRNNFYLAGSGGLLVMTLDSDTIEKAETDLGGAGKIAAGYEWWVGREFGMGVALEFMAGAVPDDDTTWGVATIGLALSATYN
jgi:hypothetical protein